MFRDVLECSGMFHVPGFIDARLWKLSIEARNAWGTFQPASSKVKKQNDVIRNRISNFDKRRISQPKIQ